MMMVTFMEVKGQQRSSAVFLESQYHQEIFSTLKDQPKNLQKTCEKNINLQGQEVK